MEVEVKNYPWPKASNLSANIPTEVALLTVSGNGAGTEPNTYFAGPMGMESMFERVLLLEDEFRSGYECDVCSKTGIVNCENCKGKGMNQSQISMPDHSVRTSEKKCSACEGTGKTKCPECNGKGELLIVPDVAKRRPTTGQIVSIGWGVDARIKVGDYFAYPGFCGEVWELSGLDAKGNESTIVLRIMKQQELLVRVTGHLELKRMKSRAAQITG